jgi:putative membrane protein insertion efficiency factor
MTDFLMTDVTIDLPIKKRINLQPPIEPTLASALCVSLLRLYQKTHILRQPSCRFYPSCSQYMISGIERFGLTNGILLGLGRLFRCHPLNCGGVDEVPLDYPSFAKIVSFSHIRAFLHRLLTVFCKKAVLSKSLFWKKGAIHSLSSPRGSI